MGPNSILNIRKATKQTFEGDEPMEYVLRIGAIQKGDVA